MTIPASISESWNTAKLYLQQGNSIKATEIFLQLIDLTQSQLAISPDNIELLGIQASAFSKLNRFDEAIANYNKIINVDPNNVGVLCNKANALNNIGQQQEALACYEHALSIQPTQIESLAGAGNIYMALGKPDKALQYYQTALIQSPHQIVLLNNSGATYLELGDYEQALEQFDKALSIDSNYVDTWCNKGNVFLACQAYQDAISCYDQALTRQHNHISSMNNKGNALAELHQYEQALACYNAVLSVQPNSDAYLNAGALFQRLHQYENAIQCYQLALQVNSQNYKAQWNLAWCYLLLGNLTLGFEYFESRLFYLESSAQPICITQPLWTGTQSLQNKSILLWNEVGGFGEAIQFIRYIKNVASLGAKIHLLTHAPLKALFRRIPEISEVVCDGEELPLSDYQCPLMSLSQRFKTTLETIPNEIPYLYADLQKTLIWKEKLTSVLPKIGIVWRSTSVGGAEKRHIDFEQLMSVFTNDMLIISLQKDIPSSDRDLLAKYNVVCVEQDLHDFDDTAALIATLDLVITIDTAVVHLAGALGKPTWALLRADADWRWLLNRDDCPWYPTVRLFRQQNESDWGPVIEQVKNELKKI